MNKSPWSRGINRAEIPLVGVAPYDDDSGQWHGRRHIAGGRAGVRQVLYVATLSAVRCNPALSAYYQRLLGRGVEPKAALIAVLRKMLTILNAMVPDNTRGGRHA